ncbi:Hypothetical predicted protein, partial [Olea europaea subsp. europaea]
QLQVQPKGRNQRFSQVIWEMLPPSFSLLNHYKYCYLSHIQNSLWLSFIYDFISTKIYDLLIMLFHARWQSKSSIHTTLAIHIYQPSIVNKSYIKYA